MTSDEYWPEYVAEDDEWVACTCGHLIPWRAQCLCVGVCADDCEDVA